MIRGEKMDNNIKRKKINIAKIKKTKTFGILPLATLVITLILTGCGGQADSKISIVGSTSVQPLVQELADKYNESNGQIKIDIQGVGSTAGIKAVYDGTCDIGTSSRKLKDEEKAWNLIETTIALDGIAVVVNPNNKVEDLSSEQISKIFKGEIKNWSELGGEDKEIIVINREAGSGTLGAFQEIMKLEKKEGDKTISLMAADALVADGNGAVLANVASKDNAIGYLSLGMADENKVKKIKIDGIEATEENVKNGKYPISRPFLILTNTDAKEETKDFINFILSDEGQQLVSKEYISVN